MKKLLSLVLVLIMAMGLIPTALAEEPAIVTVCFNHTEGLEETWPTSNELKMLEETHNIKLDFRYYDPDQYALLIAGGELPDIMTAGPDYLTTVLDNKMALNLNDYLDQMPNLSLPTYEASNELSRVLLGGEEKGLYFLAPGIGPESAGCDDGSSWGVRVRWDLYKQLGCPEINNMDDFIKVIKDMVALYPENENGEEVFGIATCNLFARWYQTGCLLMESGGLNPWIWGGTMYMSSWEDTTLYNGYTNFDRSAYWTAMKFFNKCWREGLLDPDSFIMTRAELQAKYTANRYVAAVPYEGTQIYTEASKKDPNTLMGIVSLPSPATFIFADKLMLTGNMPSDNIFVNAKSDNIENALKVIDFFHDPDVIRTIYNGKKGVDWDYDAEGKPYLTEKYFNDLTTYGQGTDEYILATGIQGQFTEWTIYQGGAMHPDGYPYNLERMTENRAKVLNPLLKDVAETYGQPTHADAMMQVVKDGKSISVVGDYGQMIATGINAVPMDIKRIMDECAKICEMAIPELVMAETDEEFAEIQTRLLGELEAADEATAWAWAEEQFNAVKAEMEPIFAPVRDAYIEANYK